MPVTLPSDLHDTLRTDLIPELDKGAAVLNVLFPSLVGQLPIDLPSSYKATIALKKVAKNQNPGDPAGPLRHLADELQKNGVSAGKDLRQWLDTVQAGGGAVGADEFEHRIVGGFRRVLLDHDTFRGHLRAVCTGNRRIVWIPPPVDRTIRIALADLATEAAGLHGMASVHVERQLGAGLGPHDIADQIALPLTGQQPGPSNGTPSASARALARWVYLQVQESEQGGLIVFSGFEPSDEETDNLIMIARLARLATTVSGAKPIRILLLGCEFGPELEGSLGGIPRTQTDEVEAATIRNEALEVLKTIPSLEDDAPEALLSSKWTEPPDVAALCEFLSEVLETTQ